MPAFVFVCAATIFGFTAVAAAGSTNSDWFARTWQTEDGLPNNNVNSIAQTADGFLWVATPLGLTRFDGVTFDPAGDLEAYAKGFAVNNVKG